jgi:hypothetical protein
MCLLCGTIIAVFANSFVVDCINKIIFEWLINLILTNIIIFKIGEIIIKRLFIFFHLFNVKILDQ